MYRNTIALLALGVFAVPLASADCKFNLNAADREWHTVWGPNAGDEREMVMPGGAGIDKIDDEWSFSETTVFTTGCDKFTPEPLRDLTVGGSPHVYVNDAYDCEVTDTGGETRQLFAVTFFYAVELGDVCQYRVHHYGFE